MSGEDSDRLSGLHEQGLIGFEGDQRIDDRRQRLRVAGRLSGSSVDDQPLGILGDLGIEVVLEAAQCRFLQPAFSVELGAVEGRRYHRSILA